MKLYQIIPLFIIIASCQSNARKWVQPEEKSISLDTSFNLNGEWNQYYSKNAIPKVLIKTIVSINKDFKLSNPTEPFLATDVILVQDQNLPARQLSFLGNSGSLWVMTYKHGGVGLHNHFIYCEIKKNHIEILKAGVSLDSLETINQIRNAISTQKIDYCEWGENTSFCKL